MTDEDGEVAELGDDFFTDAVRSSGFDGHEEVHAFLRRREKLAVLAEDLGMSREAWDALSPNKPGFEARFAQRLEDAAATVRGMAVAAE